MHLFPSSSKYQELEFEPALESFKGGRRYSQYSLCIPSQEKISSEGQNVCTVYFQERYGNVYRHRIAITITTASDAIDGEVQKEGVVVMKLQSCEFILRFSLIPSSVRPRPWAYRSTEIVQNIQLRQTPFS